MAIATGGWERVISLHIRVFRFVAAGGWDRRTIGILLPIVAAAVAAAATGVAPVAALIATSHVIIIAAIWVSTATVPAAVLHL